MDLAAAASARPARLLLGILPGAENLSLTATDKKSAAGLLRQLKKMLPEGVFLFDRENLTDAFERDVAAELIREVLLEELQQEITHSIAVIINSWKESGELILIDAILIIEREANKGIIIGQEGRMIKKIKRRSIHKIGELWAGKSRWTYSFKSCRIGASRKLLKERSICGNEKHLHRGQSLALSSGGSWTLFWRRRPVRCVVSNWLAAAKFVGIVKKGCRCFPTTAVRSAVADAASSACLKFASNAPMPAGIPGIVVWQPFPFKCWPVRRCTASNTRNRPFWPRFSPGAWHRLGAVMARRRVRNR